jgi:hypothetical protein
MNHLCYGHNLDVLWELRMDDSNINMLQECTAEYIINKQADGGVEIRMIVPSRFKMLWLVRLTDLKTSLQEIKEYEWADFDAP